MKPMMHPRTDLTGKKFGKLTVLRYAGNDDSRCAEWWVKCECGNRKIVRGANIVQGHTVSCGCERKKREVAYAAKHKALKSDFSDPLDLRTINQKKADWRKEFLKRGR